MSLTVKQMRRIIEKKEREVAEIEARLNEGGAWRLCVRPILLALLGGLLFAIALAGAARAQEGAAEGHNAGARAYSIYITTESIELAQYEGYGFQQGGYDGYSPGAGEKPRERGFPFPGPYYGPGWTYVCGPNGCGYVLSEPYGYPDGEYGYGEDD